MVYVEELITKDLEWYDQTNPCIEIFAFLPDVEERANKYTLIKNQHFGFFFPFSGTGTVTGDKTEVHALGQYFQDTPTAKAQGIYIGSTKTNIGHLESAAGVCGLIKVCLMMKNETIVPSLFYSPEKANHELTLDSYNFIVPTDRFNWIDDRNSTKCACVNSFGFGGSNAHIAVKQMCQKTKNKSNKLKQKYLVMISSQSRNGLVKNVEVFSDDLFKKPDFSLADICYTTLCARDHFRERVMVAASTKEELKNDLEEKIRCLKSQKNHKRIVFVYCGVGTTWTGMCTEMLKIEPFRLAVEKVSNELMKYTDLSIIERWVQNDDLSDPLVAHLSIFVCQVGLTELWKLYGIHPQAVVGQSVGEVAAAYCAGYLDLDSAVRLIYHRSNELRKVEGGRMIVVRNIRVEQVERICKEVTGVNIAVYLSPKSCTVAGEESAITELEHRLECLKGESQESRVKISKLAVKCAYHSPLVRAAGHGLIATVGEIQTPVKRGEIKFCSSVYGKDVGTETGLKSSYWQKNVTEPVRFYQAVRASADSSNDVCFLEIGPSPVLQAHLKDIFPDDDSYIALPSMKKGKEKDSMLLAMSELDTVSDACVDWDKFYTDFYNNHGQYASIPRYIFQERKLPYIENPGKTMTIRKTEVASHLYVSSELNDGEILIKLSISPERTPFIYDHFVKRTIVVPGVTYADVGFELAERLLGLNTTDVALCLDFKAPVILRQDQSVTMDIKTKSQVCEIPSKEIKFAVKLNNNMVCFGIVKEKQEEAPVVMQPIDLNYLKAEMQEKFDASDVYSRLEKAGFEYGKSFKIIIGGQRNENGESCLMQVRIPECIAEDMRHCHIHPCLLDSLLQSTVMLTQSNATPNEVVEIVTNQSLPIGMDRIELFGTLKSLTPESILNIVTVHFHHTELPAMKKDHYNVKLTDNDGKILAAMSNLIIYTKTSNIKACDDLKYRLTLEPLKEFAKSSTTTSDDRSKQKILLIDGSECFKKEIVKLIDSKNQCQVESADSHTQNISDMVSPSLSHLVVVFPPANDEIEDMASDVLEHSAKNCMLLQNVLQVPKTINIIIVTVGVYQHMYDDGNKTTPSVYGSEVWGFFRNAEVEFVHPRAVIVDIDSICAETISSLYSLMQTTSYQQSIEQSEYCIKSTQIYGLRLRQCTKRDITPMLRSIYRSSKSRKFCMRSSKMRQIVDPFYIAAETDSYIDIDNGNENMITLVVENVYFHDDMIYPLTRSDDLLNPEMSRATGFSVTVLEVVGRAARVGASNGERDENAFGSDHFIACCPRVGSNILQVPKACCVSLSEIPNYRPGLLFSCAYIWTLIQEVPPAAHIYVYTPDNWAHPKSVLMPQLLTSLKQCASCYQSSPSQITDSTVVLVLRPLHIRDYQDLRRCTKLITPVQFLPEKMKEKLIINDGVDVQLIETRGIFSIKNLQTLLPKVVEWLKDAKEWHTRSERENENNYSWLNDSMGNQAFGVCESIGKDFRSQMISEIKVPTHMLFDKESVYIVVGGLTGVGWWMIKILAKYGAGNIVTFGRRACRQESQTEIDNLSNLYRCHIKHMTVDVTNFNSLREAMTKIMSQPHQSNIRGIFHGAGVLDSVLVRALTKDRLKGVLSPKLVGAVNLHRLTKGLNLDYFMMTSSLASFVGSPGQSNYGAANAFMDSLANWRRSQGLAAQSINWGAIGAGMAADEKTSKELEKRGHQLLNEEEFESCFIQSLLTNETTVGYAKIIHEKMKVDFENQKLKTMATKMEFLWEENFIETKETDTPSNTGTFDSSSLASLEPKQLKIQIEKILRGIWEKIITENADEISLSESYVSLGSDSMSALNLSNVLHDTLGHTIPSEKILDPTFTLQDTVDILCSKFTSTSSTYL